MACNEKENCPGSIACLKKNDSKFPKDVLANRDRFLVAKSRLVLENIRENGWCIISDSVVDMRDIVAIVNLVIPIHVYYLKNNIEVIACMDGSEIPFLVTREISRRCPRIVIFEPTGTGVPRFIDKARDAIARGIDFPETTVNQNVVYEAW